MVLTFILLCTTAMTRKEMGAFFTVLFIEVITASVGSLLLYSGLRIGALDPFNFLLPTSP